VLVSCFALLVKDAAPGMLRRGNDGRQNLATSQRYRMRLASFSGARTTKTTQTKSSVMYRAVVLATVCAIAGFSVRAGELCVACEQPTATYLCSVEQPSGKFDLGGGLQEQICSKVLEKKGTHAKCHLAAVPDGGKCDGLPRTVTVTDYQRAIAGTAESTYEVGAFEVARENVHATWRCVTSMFKDC
jgi:hypothetical protein